MTCKKYTSPIPTRLHDTVKRYATTSKKFETTQTGTPFDCINFILLLDLKTTKLTHQDIGQMDTYVRIYDDLKKGKDDNPTIGIILCAEKNETIARYSILKESQQIFASKYQLTLPSQEELENYLQNERRKIEERGI